MRSLTFIASVLTLSGLIPAVSEATDYHTNFTYASSCAFNGPCGAGAAFDKNNVFDGNPFTVWSSVLHTSAQSGTEWLAFYWAEGSQLTDHIHLAPRVYNGQPIHMPVTLYIYYVDVLGTNQWTPIVTYSVPDNISPRGLTIFFPQAVTTNGILILADTLRAQPGTSYYYMQIAEAAGGYNACNGEDSRGIIGVWCSSTDYWPNLPTDTFYLYNPSVQIGLNKSYGGATFELYGADPSQNLIYEHGGGAMQLSLWGNGANGEQNTPGEGCNAPDNYPFNPIMAIADNCGWNGPNNDIQWSGMALGNTYIHMERSNPYQFFKTVAFQGLFWAEQANVDQSSPYARYDYHVNYTGPYTLQPTPQELPAIFTANGISAEYYYVDATGVVQTVTSPTQADPSGFIITQMPGKTDYANRTENVYTNSESWAGVCDASHSRCITVACFSPVCKEFVMSGQAGGNVTPTGNFGIVPQLDLYWSIYIFPYRYDAVVGGRSVRSWVGCLSNGTC